MSPVLFIMPRAFLMNSNIQLNDLFDVLMKYTSAA